MSEKKETIKPFTHLVLSGGGARGIFYLGCMQYMEAHPELFRTIKTMVGTSIGSLVCCALALGYTAEEIKKYMYPIINYWEIKTIDIFRFHRSYGIDRGRGLERMLKRMIYEKTGRKNYTLGCLLRDRSIHLTIATVCLEDRGTVYVSPKTMPNLKLWKAMRMSMSVPLVFTPFRYRGKTYIDGGLKDNFPIHLCPAEKTTLGILLGSKTSPLSEQQSFKRYILAIMDIVLKNYVPYDAYTIVHIHDSPNPACPIRSIQSGLEKQTLDECIDYGYKIITQEFNFPSD